MSPLSVPAHEIRPAPAGAPRAQSFDVEVPSASRPRMVYRVSREPSGAVIHHPACGAFRRGGECRHLIRALVMTERPLRTLVVDLHALTYEPAHAGPEVDPIADERSLLAWAIRVRERLDLALQANLDRERYLAREQRRAGMSREELAEDAFRRLGG